MPTQLRPNLDDKKLEIPVKKILVVDDHPANRMLAGLMLEMLGYAHEDVTSGFEALSHIKKAHYDVVLMDVQMPYLDGLETARRIRLHEKEYHLIPIPIIAMTADAARIFEVECLEAGMNGFIIKPYTTDDLAQMIQPYV